MRKILTLFLILLSFQVEAQSKINDLILTEHKGIYFVTDGREYMIFGDLQQTKQLLSDADYCFSKEMETRVGYCYEIGRDQNGMWMKTWGTGVRKIRHWEIKEMIKTLNILEK